MQWLAALPHLGGGRLPRVAPKQGAVIDGRLHQLRALVVDATGAERVVADLTVAHVGVARHADGDAVRTERGVQSVLTQPVEVGLTRQVHRVAFVVLPEADSVHDTGDDRAGGTGERRVSLELPTCHGGILAAFGGSARGAAPGEKCRGGGGA